VFWLTERLEFPSASPPVALLHDLRARTHRYWSHNAYGDTIIGVFIGSRLLIWRSRRGTLSFYIPRPFFFGVLSVAGAGSSLVGRFSGPILEPLLLLFFLAWLGVGWAAIGLAPALGVLLAVLVPFWFAGQRVASRYLESDRPVIESMLREASVGAPAA
jgi:hypothetical protein